MTRALRRSTSWPRSTCSSWPSSQASVLSRWLPCATITSPTAGTSSTSWSSSSPSLVGMQVGWTGKSYPGRASAPALCPLSALAPHPDLPVFLNFPLHTHTHSQAHASTYTSKHTHIHTSTHTQAHANTRAHICTLAHTCTDLHITLKRMCLGCLIQA